jgi:hypothetical protein
MAERISRWRFLLLILLLPLTAFPIGAAGAQDEELPGVRGSLYESPTFGWILVAPAAEWSFVNAESVGGYDTVHLVSKTGDGARHYFFSWSDDGRGEQGCLHDLVDSLASSHQWYVLEGRSEPGVGLGGLGAGAATARARLVTSGDPEMDLLAFIMCERDTEGLLIGSVLLRRARDLETDADLPLLEPLWPGQGHTGRPRAGSTFDTPATGVVRFAGANETGGFAPFQCGDREPSASLGDPPPNTGWLICAGTIVNLDVLPAMVDLTAIRLGCARASRDDAGASCPSTPLAPTFVHVLKPEEAEDRAGPLLTLPPGTTAAVALWYAVPDGAVPFDLLYLEPDRSVFVGPTLGTESQGNQPVMAIAP